MLTRPLGASGLSVSVLGLGLAALGRPAYITTGRAEDLGEDRSPADMERRCHEMLDAAYDAGVRYVDAARSYGSAEAFLASWLERRQPSDLVVGSKWGYRYVGDWLMDAPVHEIKDHSLAAFERQRDETLGLLGTHLSIYQIHSATLESGVLGDRGVLEAMASLRTHGVRSGLSVSGPKQGEVISRVLDIEADGQIPFDTVQATWNLLEPSAGPALCAARDAGLGVLVKEVLANGRLVEVMAGRGGLALFDGANGEQLAIASALAQPWVDVVLLGAVTPGQLETDLGAPSVELAADSLRELTEQLAEPPEHYWSRRAALPWA